MCKSAHRQKRWTKHKDIVLRLLNLNEAFATRVGVWCTTAATYVTGLM